MAGFDTHADNDGNPQDVIYLAGTHEPVQTPLVPEKIEDVMPDSCFFNPHPFSSKLKFTSGARIFLRNPRRQWRRSLCDETGMFTSPLKPFFNKVGKTLPNEFYLFSFKVVEALLQPTYPTIREALAMLPRIWAVAVSPMHCLTLSPADHKPLLCSFPGFIGELDEERQTITMKHSLATQEVLDFLTRTNQLQWKIRHA